MKRLHGSLMAYPIDYDVPSESNVLYNMSQMDCSNIYSKLIIADRSDVMAIIERERKELEVQLKEGDNDPERCFIEQAITLLTDRESFVLRNEVENAVGALTECTESTHRCDYLQPLKYHYFYQGSYFLKIPFQVHCLYSFCIFIFILFDSFRRSAYLSSCYQCKNAGTHVWFPGKLSTYSGRQDN